MARRFNELTAQGFPYLVAVVDETVVGYAYAGPYRARPAYRFTVENSVYVAHDSYRRGVGKALLEALIEASTEKGFRLMVAVIGDSNQAASIRLHEATGFKHVGCFHSRPGDRRWFGLSYWQGDAFLGWRDLRPNSNNVTSQVRAYKVFSRPTPYSPRLTPKMRKILRFSGSWPTARPSRQP